MRSPLLERVDHLVYASPDLPAAVDLVEARFGVRASPGGRHPGLGTRNVLLALGPRCYLEVIGPDPEQADPPAGRPFGIDRLSEPRLVTWAANVERPHELSGYELPEGLRLGEPVQGRRRTSEGTLLSWTFTDPYVVLADGVVPFLIDWGRSPHPASTARPGGSLVALRSQHPDPGPARAVLAALGLDLDVAEASEPGLVATIDTARGTTELR